MCRHLGFNFLRVPLNTKFFFANADVNQPAIQYWENLDELISWGIQYKVHISLVVCETYGHNCTYTEEESTLFQNQQQMDLFVTFWDTVAKRYADIPNNALSFNLLNEPCDYIGEDVYCEMALHLAEVIRAHTPDRLIISDMFSWGKEPLEGLVGSGIVQTIHCYEPNALHSGELEEWPSIPAHGQLHHIRQVDTLPCEEIFLREHRRKFISMALLLEQKYCFVLEKRNMNCLKNRCRKREKISASMCS